MTNVRGTLGAACAPAMARRAEPLSSPPRRIPRSRFLLSSALTAPALVLAGAALTVLAGGPVEATPLNCSVTGTTMLQNCNGTNVYVTMTPGTGSLTVEDLTTVSIIYASPQTAGTYDQTVEILGATSIDNPNYSGLVMQFGTDTSTPPQRNEVVVNATVNIGANVVATSGPSGGFGTIWVLNDNAGNIVIDNAGQITLNAPNTSTAAISGATNLGAVTITNSGLVTSNGGRGIYADGNCGPVGPDGCLGADTPVTVSVTNTSTGVVNATTAAIRVIDYHGLATITNHGSVTSELFQGLIAWSNNGDATVTNTGSVTSNTDNAVYASTETGKATVINSGTVTATGDPTLDAARAAIRDPAGYAGLIGSATTSGDIVITNESTGHVTANRDAAIRAETPLGNVTVVNDGTLTGQSGIVVESGLVTGHTNATVATITGDASVTNTGTVTATSYAVSLNATTNTLTNSGTLTSTGTIAVLTGDGNTTITNTGTIEAASEADTAISMGAGSNTLLLSDTAILVGKVVNASSNNTLGLIGTGSGALNLGTVGASGKFQGFANLTKAGTGTWTVSGSGSSLSGELNVQEGTLALTGSLSVTTATVGSDASATLAISGGGSLTSANATVGGPAGGVGTVTISGVGSSWTNTSELTVGYDGGTGSITVSDGASLTARRLALSTASWESGSGGNGSLTVTGAGTSWHNTGGVDIARTAGSTGSLTVSNGAFASITNIGIYTGAGAQVMFTGAGTHVEIGDPNNRASAAWLSPTGGTVTVSDAAYLFASGIYVGAGGGDLTTMTVTGAGTVVDAAERVYVGGQNGSRNVDPVNGNGQMTISNGAVVTTAAVGVGMDPNSVGRLTVTGAGSQIWAKANADYNALGNVYVGYNGTATVIVADGATIKADNEVRIGYDETGSGTLVIGAESGSAAVAAGTISAPRIVFGTAGGQIVLNHTDTDYVLSADISGNGALNVLSGATYLTGTNTYTQGTSIAAGSGLAIGNGGTTGSITGNVVNNGVLAFFHSDDVTFGGIISGTGIVGQAGSGTLTLTGVNTYSGGTIAVGGTISIASDAALGAVSGALTLRGGTLATTSNISTSRNVVLETGGGTLQVANDTTLTLSGVISGAETLTKTGAGTLVLTGTNTYTGLTTISAGVLQLGNGGTTGSILGDVVNNATLIFNRSDTYTFAGSISGSGAVLFQGGGTVLFSSPYQGAVTVENSTVTLEQGVTTTSVFTVDNGGTLGGSGTIGGVVANNGSTVSPGYSPGTLAVAGAVNFNTGSTYEVDVTPQGAHDLITATGAVTISSGAAVAVRAESGIYRALTTYTILTTTDQVTGTFGSITSDYAFLTPTLGYDAQNVYLTLNYNGLNFTDFAQTPNQLAVAAAAEVLPIGNQVWESLVTLPVGAVAPALNQLSGEAYASVNTVIQQEAIFLRDAVNARLRQGLTPAGAQALGYAANAAGPATAALGEGLTPTLWMQGYGAWGNVSSNGNAASISSSIGGFLAGLDVGVGGNSRVGLVAGYSQSQFDVDARNSTGTIGNFDLGLYAGTQLGPWALRGGVSYTWHDVSVDRSIVFPGFSGSTSGGYTQGTTQVFGEAAYDFAVGAYAFEPFLGLAYVNLSGASTQEAYTTAAALSVDVQGQSTFYTTLGLRAATSMNVMGHTLTPSVTVGWQHAFGDTSSIANMMFAGTTTPFQVEGVPIAQDAAILGAGLAYALSNQATIQVNYAGQIASQASQNAVTAQFSLKF
ncbi:autotransporter domain-containing protein [Aquabacter sp. L1I39]|uniref:autotransporter domain-containing protein n=1 Tax=Aquabacter sp. L1I39 TaxID=2820278 RepID=UPI001ADD1219|nr:autotransporter domain-containing protein [Aquabacter sp. L1I39]QTL04661.1 autotransporter domain-containing protein [Aquabacter sp. L1I39]